MNVKHPLIFAPGPTNLEPVVAKVLGEGIIHHRTAEFSRVMDAVCHKLERVFATKQGETLIVSSSGSGGIEAGLVSLFQPHDQVLLICNGHFGEQLGKIAERLHLEVIQVRYPWGTPYQMEDVQAALALHPDIKGILVVHSETSTGELADVKALGDVTQQTERLLFVDAVSGLLFNEFLFDEWHLDFAVSASQKGFGLPPGLAFVCLSPKAMTRFHDASTASYLDLKQYVAWKRQVVQTPTTPNVLAILSADVALELILERGLEWYQTHSRALIRRYKAALLSVGYLSLVPRDTDQAGGVAAFVCPLGIQSSALQAYLLETEGIYVACGMGEHRQQILRISAMSLYQEADLERLLNAIITYTNQHRLAR